ncbi:MAG: hypothetical protein JNL49_04600 [Bacteroidia bacterium]|jgi:NADH:ubiquinone oxidoreductase subunit 6 (subunit J)|nr:hypothetical protein [Bacteroidia bacterium]
MKIVPNSSIQNSSPGYMKMAQSASALGAGILGFGLGAKLGLKIDSYAILIIIVGAIFHVYGMYIMQMKDYNKRTLGIVKVLWISAWICLVVLAAIVIYLLSQNK